MKTDFFKLLLYSLLSLFYVSSVSAQQLISRPMPFLDKLSTNEITVLHQDKEGFIWIGTSNGLQRYDGYNIQEFRSNYKAPRQLTHNGITCFTEDETHLWVGTSKGINLIDKTTYQITPFPDPDIQDKSIRYLFTDRKGNTWININHLLYKCTEDYAIEKVYTFQALSNTIYEDHAGILWLLTWGEGLFRYDEDSDSFVAYPRFGRNRPYRMFQDQEELYWIVSWGDGLWRFDPQADNGDMFYKQSVLNPTRSFPEEVFYDIIQDDVYGYLWALSHFGFYTFRVNDRNELEQIDINQLAGPGNQIDKNKTYSHIIKDAAGNLWIGAFDKGYTVVFEKGRIENYLMDDIKNKIGLDANILYLNKDNKGVIWFNQARYGLCLFHEETGKVTYGIDQSNLYSIDLAAIVPASTGGMWLGGRGDYQHKVWKMKQDGMQISILEEIDLHHILPSSGFVTQLAEDRYGNLWIGTSTHLFIRPAHSGKTSVVAAGLHVTDLAEDQQGYLWVATPHTIYQFRYEEEPLLVKQYPEEVSFLQEDNIKRICADSQGNIWFSTFLGRLFLLDRKEEKITDQTDNCGLKGDAVLKILSQGEEVWIVHSKYMIRHNFVRKDNISYSVNDDNIFISSVRYGAAFLDPEGNLYAGGHEGVFKIYPAVYDNNPVTGQKVLITDIKADNHSLLFSPANRNSGNSVNKITLPSDAKNIGIEFSSLTYVSTRRIKYAYKLDGVDKNWIYIDDGRHSAFYNRLEKGTYTFRVKATDRYGNWTGAEQLLTIHRLPALYETWYAYLIFVLVAVVLIYYSFWQYIRRMKKRTGSNSGKNLPSSN
ncbi:MAG: hypothetical protein LUE93_12380 [Bacteroides sp.]|nr:hypothetical protein [Bacteroides sp.]